MRIPLDILIDNIVHMSEQWMISDIVVHDCKMLVIPAYAPTVKSAVWETEKFYTGLSLMCLLETAKQKTVY